MYDLMRTFITFSTSRINKVIKLSLYLAYLNVMAFETSTLNFKLYVDGHSVFNSE